MNPQQQDIPIDQLPDERLALYGWNIRETQDGHRKQIDVCENQLSAIRQEFIRRSQARMELAQKEQASKQSSEDALVDKLMSKISDRLPPTVAEKPPEEPK